MIRVMAVDAGQSTGIAIADFTDDGFEWQHIEQFHEPRVAHNASTISQTAGVWSGYLGGYNTPDTVIVEQFDLRPSNNFLADLSTVEVNAILKFLWGEDNIVWQTPAQAKGLVNDKVLKNLGLWPTGKTVGQPDADDVRDAMRHVVYYGLTVLKHRPMTEAAWPRQ